MRNMGDIENYLIEMDMPYEEIGDGIWLLKDDYDHLDNIVISWSEPLVIFRVKLMDLPKGDNTKLYKKLLELNATEMVHGAYGIEEDAVVAIDTLQSENLDHNEFKASVDALAMAIHEHYPVLAGFRSGEAA